MVIYSGSWLVSQLACSSILYSISHPGLGVVSSNLFRGSCVSLGNISSAASSGAGSGIGLLSLEKRGPGSKQTVGSLLIRISDGHTPRSMPQMDKSIENGRIS
ncbi:hypothetical protein Tco_0788636 [Tanacetum coccineum]